METKSAPKKSSQRLVENVPHTFFHDILFFYLFFLTAGQRDFTLVGFETLPFVATGSAACNVTDVAPGNFSTDKILFELESSFLVGVGVEFSEDCRLLRITPVSDCE